VQRPTLDTASKVVTYRLLITAVYTTIVVVVVVVVGKSRKLFWTEKKVKKKDDLTSPSVWVCYYFSRVSVYFFSME